MPSDSPAPPLREDLRAGRLRRALLCHVHDRWYLGELFCHASWVGCLHEAGIATSICTNAAYLELFEHHPGVDALYPAERLDDALLARFDLVVFATTHPPHTWAPRLPRAIYAWNEGIAFAREGRVERQLERRDPNLFAATRHRRGQTALPDGEYLTLRLTREERAAADRTLRTLGARGDERPIVVVNPSASNAHTRATTRPKAVENALGVHDAEQLVEQLLRQLPGDRVLVAAPLKPGDEQNHAAMVAVGERFAGEPRVLAPLRGVDPRHGCSMRAFAALLTDRRVRGMVGNSTGSNAHLAAALAVPAVSIERAADDEMLRNWAAAGRGQMGSFRWRNPQPCTAAVSLRWDDRTPAGLGGAVRLLRWRLAVRERGWVPSLRDGADAAGVRQQARAALRRLSTAGEDPAGACGRELRRVAELLPDDVRELVCDFRDEAAFCRATGHAAPAAALDGLTAVGRDEDAPRGLAEISLAAPERELLDGLIASSNLLKELRAAAAVDVAAPDPPAAARAAAAQASP